MARQAGSNMFAGTLEVLAGGPLDARQIVNLKADLTSVGSFPYPYIGMQVYVVSEDKRYTLINMDTTQDSSWREDGSGGDTIQFDTMPTADSSLEGKIIQYVGTTDTDYTKGLFYECVESTDTPGTYEWVASDTVDTSELLHKDGSVAADKLTVGARMGTAPLGNYAFENGAGVLASGLMSHAEGLQTQATAQTAHAEGMNTRATGDYSHAEGNSSYATAAASHAEGQSTEANGNCSHTEGYFTVAGYYYQHVSGMYNDNKENTLLEIGNGTGDIHRSNAFEVYKDGHINVNGDIYQNGVKRDLTSVYHPSGSVAFASLPTLAAAVLGNVYNVTDDFTTTSDFIEGAGKDYPAGTNVAVINAGTEATPDYKFDCMPGFIDLSGYQELMQVSTLPTASDDEEGKIYQYIGATTATLTSGYFYICEEDSENPGTYIWTEKSVQSGGSGSSAELSDSLTVTQAAGGIKVGDTYAAGTSLETLWRDLLNPTAYPTLTAPSATITVSGDKLLETGTSVSKTFTVTFDRGSINPAYGTSGFRSGVATGYSLNGGASQASNTFTETVDSTHKTFQGTVSHEAGEQPKNSIGGNYDSPLPAGSVNSNTITYEFVDALWANTASIGTVAKLALVSKTAKQKDLVFPAQTVENPETFDVPASWSVTAVQVKNDLSGAYEDASAQFTVTTTTHNDAAGNPVNYNRYAFSLGYATGSRTVRLKWN